MGEQNSPDGPSGIYVLPKADTSFVARKFLDLTYAVAAAPSAAAPGAEPSASPSAFQKLDIYLPEGGSKPYPVIVAIHGGAWMMCDKNDLQVLPMLEGLKRGYAVVAVNYRLSQEALFPAQIQDVKAALRWVRANAAEYGFDVDRIAAWGGSAGGHLASLVGLTAGVAALEDGRLGNPAYRSDVAAVVAWYAPTDFLKMDAYLAESGLGPRDHGKPDSPESRLLGATIADIPDRVRFANPETYVHAGAPPFFLQHGTTDSTVPMQHSVSLAEKLKKANGTDKVFLEILDGAEHADCAFETKANVAKVLDFLDNALDRRGR
jgi:acetyl esterase/lipase